MKHVPNFSLPQQNYFLWDADDFDSDSYVQLLIAESNWNVSLSDYAMRLYFQNASKIRSTANYLFAINIHDEALDFYKQLLQIYESRPKQKSNSCNVVFTNNRFASCLIFLRQTKEDLKYLNYALHIKKA